MRDTTLPPAAARRLDEACDRFEAACKAAPRAGPWPRIEDYLSAVPLPEEPRLLRELIALDAAYRRKAGRNPVPKDYHALFSEKAPDWLAPVVDGLPLPGVLPAVSGYEVLGELGRGGMAVVYQARQTALKRIVALKMILAGAHAGDQERARFRREAEAVARLKHPHIVQIYEVGEHGGLPFFSLEFMEGGSLHSQLAGRARQPEEVARLVRILAAAMHHAHRRGIVHRDLKPGNVLLAMDGTPKVADFGLAKLRTATTELTGTGALLGTPSYMAPEQARGQANAVGPRTDVYALGAILYELLTGAPPFRGQTALETLEQVLSREPIPPRRLRPETPADLETICLKALAKEPGRRYAGARELADDLGRFLKGEPIAARSVGRAERWAKWARRRPAVAMVYGLLVVVVVQSLVGVGSGGSGSARERDLEQVKEDKKTAETARDQLATEKNDCAREREAKERVLYLRRVSLAYAKWEGNEITQAERLLNKCPKQQRGWEWYFVKQLWRIPTRSRTLEEHAAVASVCFSPDNKRLASASADGTVKVWAWATAQAEGPPWGHLGDVYSVCFSPADGKLLASASADKTVKVWDLQTGKEALSLQGHTGTVYGVAFSPDGQRLTSASADGTVKVWDLQTGKEALSLTEHTGPVRGVAFSPDGQRLASASADKTVKVWDAWAGGKALFTLLGHTGVVHSVCFHPDGQCLASASEDGTVKVWDLASGDEIFTLKVGHSPVSSVCFSPDGKCLASGSNDGMIRVWDASDSSAPRRAP